MKNPPTTLRGATLRLAGMVDLVKSIQDALGTAETGEALVEVARNAHRAEQRLAQIERQLAQDTNVNCLEDLRRILKEEINAAGLS